MSCSTIVRLLFFCALASSVSVSSTTLQDFQANTVKLQQLNNLAYGATCSYVNEQKRSAFGLKLMEVLKSGSLSSIGSLNQEMVGLLGSNYCNSLQNLQCQSNNKCGCASGDSAGYSGISFQSIREDNACRLSRSSICMPEESLKALGSQAPDLKCQRGTTCKFKDGTGCTNAKIIAEVQRGFRNRRPSMSQVMTRVQEELQDGICQCG